MQIQKTDTIPYILTKQYAISLASQVLNNVSIDRSQQAQIEELKTISENKVNKSDLENNTTNVDLAKVSAKSFSLEYYDPTTDTTKTGKVDSNLVPSTDNMYGLGSKTKRWNDIYSMNIQTNNSPLLHKLKLSEQYYYPQLDY